MKCEDCPYLWMADGDRFPSCHFEGDMAPCEYDDYEAEEEYEV